MDTALLLVLLWVTTEYVTSLDRGVSGNAARADHQAYYGYQRETNAFTKPYKLTVFPAGEACNTYTLASTACMLSHIGHVADWQQPTESLPNYLSRNQVATIVRSNNSVCKQGVYSATFLASCMM